MGELELVLNGIAIAAQAVGHAKQLYDSVKGTLSSDDEVKLREAMEKLRVENEQLYAQTIDRLDAEARRP